MNLIIDKIRALDNYQRGNANFTTTELIEPERIRSLSIAHAGEIKEEEPGVWRVMGSALHQLLKEAGALANQEEDRFILEERFHATMPGGKIVSSQIDVYDRKEKTLDNYKVCSVWKFILGDSPEWEQQLNVEACVLRMNGLEVRQVRNIAFLRDWNMRKARLGKQPDYPQSDIHTVDMPLWSMGEAQEFILERIRKHEAAKDNPPLCTKAERWQRDASFALMQKGRKAAIRLFFTQDQAEAAMGEMERREIPGRHYYVEERQAEPVRCLDYCPCQPFCDFGISAMKKWRENDEP